MLDSIQSVVHEILLLEKFAVPIWLPASRQIVAEIVVFASIVMGYVLLFVPQLPRLIFIPLIVFALWCFFGSPGASVAFLGKGGLVIAAAQLILADIALALLWAKWGSPFVVAARLPVKNRMVLRTVAAIVSAVIATPLLLGAFAAYTYAATVERMSGGYISFGWTALYAKETVMKRGNQTVELLATMHLGEPEFYASLRRAMRDGGLVLTEGVSDRGGRLRDRLSYNKVASVLGLSAQGNFEDWDDLAPESKSSPSTRPKNSKDGSKKTKPISAPRIDIVNADIDIAEFHEETIGFLEEVAQLYASHSRDEIIARFKRLSAFDRRTSELVLGDILTLRNNHLIDVFDKLSGDRSAIVIPWGALHMPAISAALQKRGFVVVSESTHPIFNYRTIAKKLKERAPQQPVAPFGSSIRSGAGQ